MSSGPHGPASSVSSWQEDFEFRQRDFPAWESRWVERYESDFIGDAWSRGTQSDDLDYEDLRVSGLRLENKRRRGRKQTLREPLLEQIAQDAELRRGRNAFPSWGEWARMPRPARSPMSIGTSADLRNFQEMRWEALRRECCARGLYFEGPRSELIRRILDDVDFREREAASRVRLAGLSMSFPPSA